MPKKLSITLPKKTLVVAPKPAKKKTGLRYT